MCHSEVSIRECFTLGLVCVYVCVFSVMSRKDTLLRRNVTHQYTICVVSMTSALLLSYVMGEGILGERAKWSGGGVDAYVTTILPHSKKIDRERPDGKAWDE